MSDVRGPNYLYYVVVGDKGNPTAFFPQLADTPEDIQVPLPSGAIQVTEEQWHSWMADNTQRLINGALVSGDAK